jgi:hypothetical protein
LPSQQRKRKNYPTSVAPEAQAKREQEEEVNIAKSFCQINLGIKFQGKGACPLAPAMDSSKFSPTSNDLKGENSKFEEKSSKKPQLSIEKPDQSNRKNLMRERKNAALIPLTANTFEELTSYP